MKMSTKQIRRNGMGKRQVKFVSRRFNTKTVIPNESSLEDAVNAIYKQNSAVDNVLPSLESLKTIYTALEASLAAREKIDLEVSTLLNENKKHPDYDSEKQLYNSFKEGTVTLDKVQMDLGKIISALRQSHFIR